MLSKVVMCYRNLRSSYLVESAPEDQRRWATGQHRARLTKKEVEGIGLKESQGHYQRMVLRGTFKGSQMV